MERRGIVEKYHGGAMGRSWTCFEVVERGQEQLRVMPRCLN
jgi:hypothetical protein